MLKAGTVIPFHTFVAASVVAVAVCVAVVAVVAVVAGAADPYYYRLSCRAC